MKSFKTCTLRAAALLLCSAGLVMSSAVAQQDAPPPPPDGQMQGPPPGPGRGPDHRMEMLQSQLQLSPEQATQMKAILMDQRAKMDALRTNGGLPPKEIREHLMAIHEESTAKIHAILTPDQQTKYDAMQAKMREHAEQHHGMGGPPPAGAGAPPPPPPPQ